jgi:hypothetical protein
VLAFFQYTGLPVLAGMRKLLSYGTTTASTVTWTRTRISISTADRGSAEHQSHTHNKIQLLSADISPFAKSSILRKL